MKGTTIMYIGSIMIIPLALLTPKEYLLVVGLPFIIVELIIAFYFTFKNYSKERLGG